MEDRLRGVYVGEEEVDACRDHFHGQEASLPEVRRRVRCFLEAMLLGGSELRLTLSFPEFRDDLGPASLGTLLLRDGVVGAGQAGGGAVLARP